jgi:hypothetical protein
MTADVRQIDHDANAVHFADYFAAETGQAAVAFIAARADQVLRVVAKLHDAHAHIGEGFDIAQVVLERMGVLEAENHAGAVFLLGPQDVVGGAHERQQLAVLADLLLHQRDVVDGLGKALPDRHRAVRGGNTTLLHVFEHRTIESRNIQTVDDDAVLVQSAHSVCSIWLACGGAAVSVNKWA